ncbi:hypothetical protein HYH03_010483 [Edaphochlamys debaryana]|uniref:Uncharacterized protein n=1 Tax=Edaphochlamys debaryana TaxID=47281 RepID=A0A836BVU5_9CHLO|nr:hypothetical protein HYH03_010483 [Edaphochlamys debaryana]|eukprot:KAG2491036.1 hypothetical protein HYH03_010483 [Edaphochlamys debaryana]
MSSPAPGCNPWGHVSEAAQQQQLTASSSGSEQHRREQLGVAFNRVLAALDAASRRVLESAAGLADLQASQTDVSARLSGRAGRCTGRKRKLSPCVYDVSDGGYFSASCRADTPTQELLPASRSELRTHQLAAVRWLVALQGAGGGGVLADEAEGDRRAEVAGLLAHLAANPPQTAAGAEPHHPLGPRLPSVAEGGAGPAGAGAHEQRYGALGGRAGGGGGGPEAAPHACLLLAPASRLAAWGEAIREVVDVELRGLEALAEGAAGGPQPFGNHVPSAGGGGAPSGGMCGGPSNVAGAHCSGGRRSAVGGAGPSSAGGSLSGGSSAAGVFPAACAPASLQPGPLQLQAHMRQALGGAPPAPGPPRLQVVLAPLEALAHAGALLAPLLPLRLLVVDLAAEQGPGGGSLSGSGEWEAADFSFRLAGGGAAGGSRGGSGSGPRRGLTDLGGLPSLHLLSRLPAECRVLLSAGDPQPPASGSPSGGALPGADPVWLLLQLLAPAVQQPLWEAVGALQTALLAAGSVGAEAKEGLLSEVRSRLWGALRPLVLARAARESELSFMRGASTNLNLYDHFSAARAPV